MFRLLLSRGEGSRRSFCCCCTWWKRGRAWRRWVERGWVRFRVRDGGGDKGARTSLVSGRRKNCSGVQIIGRCFVYKFSSTLEARKGDTILFTSYPFPRPIVSHSQSPSNDPLQRSLPTFSSPLPFRRLITINRLLQKEISQATVSQKLVEQTNNDRWGGEEMVR